MNEGAAPVCKFLLVQASVRAHEEAACCRHTGVAYHRIPKGVYLRLSAFHGVNNAEAAGGTLYGVHSVYKEGIHSVVVKAALLAVFVIFRGVQQDSVAEFGKMEYGAPAVLLFVVPVHYAGFVRGVHGIVVNIFRCIEAR